MMIYHSDARNNTNLPNNLIQNESTTVMLLLFLTIHCSIASLDLHTFVGY